MQALADDSVADPGAALLEIITSRLVISELSAREGSCLDLTVGGTEKVCLYADLLLTDVALNFTEAQDDATIQAGSITCAATIDDVMCNSCEIYGDFCVKMDCTNIVEGSVIDDCSADPMAGIVGPLEPYYILEGDFNASATTITVGECGKPEETPAPGTPAPGTPSPGTTSPDDSPAPTSSPTESSGGNFVSIKTFGWTALAAAAALAWSA